MPIETVNPATGEVIKRYPTQSITDVDAIIQRAHEAFLRWRQTSFADRAAKMRTVAQILLTKKQEFAHLISTEMGKPLAMATAEIEKCARACEHFAEHAALYLQPKPVKTELTKSYIDYQPTGVIFAIMPWNFPFWQVFRFAAPNLMAGNVGILKHAPITTGCGLAIQQIFTDAGFPSHIFSTIIIDDKDAAHVIQHPRIAGVTLTGSQRAGRAVAELAGHALKKVVLELGGSDPYLILADADLDQAVDACVTARMNNSGQVCIAAKRTIIVDSIYRAFTDKLLKKIAEYPVGNPLDENTRLGPLARADLRDTVAHQVDASVAKGALLLAGGKPASGKGFYYPPTVLGHVTPGMPAFDEEIFGPVIALISAADEADAIKLANQSTFGLSAAVFTRDITRGEKIAAEQLEVGTCVVNGIVSSDPRLPFGGTKQSGFGRELSEEGIREFMNIKTICVK